MPRKCCVMGCRSNYNSQVGYVTVFSFPRERDSAQLRASWIDAIGRPGYNFTKHSGVCILHFPERQIIRSESFIDSNGIIQIVQRKLIALTKDAVPSLALNRPDIDSLPASPTTTTTGTTTRSPSKGVNNNNKRKAKSLKLSPAPKPTTPNELQVVHIHRIIREDRLNGFNELQNSFQFRLQQLLDDNKWSVKLERDNYILFYKISVCTDTLIPRLTSVCVKNDMTVKVSADCDRIIIGDFAQLKSMFQIRSGTRVERWCEMEELLKTAETLLSSLQVPVETSATNGESELVIEQVESPTVLVKEASERLQRAAKLLDNQLNRGPTLKLEFLSEQALLAITRSKSRRRYGERMKRIASHLYAHSPDTYRLLRDLNMLSLPFESTLKKGVRPHPSPAATDARTCSLPILSELLRKGNTDSDGSFSEESE